MIEKKPFVAMDLGEEQGGSSKKQDIVPVWLGVDDRALLERWKRFIYQPKDSTAIKSALSLSMKLTGDPFVAELISLVFKNKAKNKRSGYAEYE